MPRDIKNSTIVKICVCGGILLLILIIKYLPIGPSPYELEDIVRGELFTAEILMKPDYWVVRDEGASEVIIVPAFGSVVKDHCCAGTTYSREKLLQIHGINKTKNDLRGIKNKFVKSPQADNAIRTYLDDNGKEAPEWENLVEAKLVK